MLALQTTSLHRKGDLQPSNSLDSAQTAQTQAQQQPGGRASPDTITVSHPSAPEAPCSLLPASDGIYKSGLDPRAAKMAIKEALAPLGPSELAMVQEQLRQSRLARQREAWTGEHAANAEIHVSAQSSSPEPLTCDDVGGGFKPLVQQVASALASGTVSPQDIARVLSALDPSVFRALPQQQEQHWMPEPQLRKPQAAPQHSQLLSWGQHSSHSAPSALSMPAAVPMPPSPFYSSQVLPSFTPRQQMPQPAQRSVAGPYSAVLSSLTLPPAALAAHAAAATAADAAAAARMRHPGSSTRKGRRSSRMPRGQLSSLLRSVSTASDAMGVMHAGAVECQYADTPAYQQHAAGCLLYMAAQPDDAHSQEVDAAAAAAAPLLCTEPALDTPAGPACYDDHCPEAEAAAAAVPVPLGVRFARLSPAVQQDILQQLDELSAMEDELRGGSAAPDHECQGPRRSGRARKVRNLDDDRFAANKGTTRSSSPTPGPSDAAEELTQQQGGRAGHKRMRLDACSSQGAGALGSASPQPSSRTPQQQQQGQPMEADMPPALDLWVAPEPLALEPEAAAPRRRRIPRKAGPRASARKRMHRATFKRGKPQRAPVA